ncbi:MAG: hypothetical protein QM657_07110 [Lacrimispora sp.]|uniref:hypothetical protein n=1 Tax=Lacrimispora sp. TaxID=2719234 RepID=UPI0039E47079
MNCCAKCFQDAQIRAIIKTNNQIGDCDFCGQKNTTIYSMESSSDLSDLISGVINVYEEVMMVSRYLMCSSMIGVSLTGRSLLLKSSWKAFVV